MVQWLRLRIPNAGGTRSIPGQGTKILHATWPGQKKKTNKHVYTGRKCTKVRVTLISGGKGFSVNYG